MKSKLKPVKYLLFALLSFLAGSANGFLGTGGGVIFVYTLSTLTENPNRSNFSTALCATVPLSAVSLFSYARAGNVNFPLVGTLWLPCVLGGLLGAFLLSRLKLSLLNIIFASLVIYAGACMILR
jgi:uncharacterized membrane protein YfcA